MRVMTCALIALLLPAATAQAQRTAAPAVRDVPAPRDPLPRFTIALRGALGPIGLPLPQIGLTPPRPREHGRRSRDHAWYPWSSWLYYVPEPVVYPPEPAPKQVEEPRVPGRVILDIAPAGAQVFANGYYVGLTEDFSAARGGGLLEPGLHRLDVSAPGYESITTDLSVTAGQPVTIRGTLKALPPPVTSRPTTFYLIPGCYMGNIPPQDAGLPATCDVGRAVTWRP